MQLEKSAPTLPMQEKSDPIRNTTNSLLICDSHEIKKILLNTSHITK